jgi:hypothetical protein
LLLSVHYQGQPLQAAVMSWGERCLGASWIILSTRSRSCSSSFLGLDQHPHFPTLVTILHRIPLPILLCPLLECQTRSWCFSCVSATSAVRQWPKESSSRWRRKSRTRTSFRRSIRAGRVSIQIPVPCTNAQFLTLSAVGAYHLGEEPDDRTLSTLEDHGITDYVHAARKVRGVFGPRSRREDSDLYRVGQCIRLR